MSDDYSEREKRGIDDLGGQLSAIALAAVNTDLAAKDALMKRNMKVLEADPVAFTGEKRDGDAVRSVSYLVPAAALVDMGGLQVESVDFNSTMNIHSSNETSDTLTSDVETNATVEFGFGPVSGSASLTASVGIEKSQKRSSDYSRSVELNVALRQTQPPEGLARLLDALVDEVGQLEAPTQEYYE